MFIQVLQRKVGGVNGKEVTDPHTFTSLFNLQEIPLVSLDTDRYIARPETIKGWTNKSGLFEEKTLR
jgi:hypothetical protein